MIPDHSPQITYRRLWNRYAGEMIRSGKLTFWQQIYSNSPEAWANYFLDEEEHQQISQAS